ncbi:MAG: hypothetical protein ACI8VC_001006 [Candidatus Endobugula sp.]|jgi:hypothetical protein
MTAKKTQVTLYMNTRNQGHSQVKAAALAGIHERTARRIGTQPRLITFLQHHGLTVLARVH